MVLALTGEYKAQGNTSNGTDCECVKISLFFSSFIRLPSDTNTSRFSPPIANATAAQKDNKKTRNRFLHHFTFKSSLPDLHFRNIPFSKILVAGNSINGALRYIHLVSKCDLYIYISEEHLRQDDSNRVEKLYCNRKWIIAREIVHHGCLDVIAIGHVRDGSNQDVNGANNSHSYRNDKRKPLWLLHGFYNGYH